MLGVGVSFDGEQQRYFFMHIPRTAGTTLYRRLIRTFGDTVYPLPFDRGRPDVVLNVGHAQDRFRTYGDQIRVVVGHFPLCLGDLLGVPLTAFTVLRDPVERTLSLLRLQQQQNETYRGASLETI